MFEADLNNVKPEEWMLATFSSVGQQVLPSGKSLENHFCFTVEELLETTA